VTGFEGIDVERLVRDGSPTLVARCHELAPRVVLAYDRATWLDAIVFVTAGAVELEDELGRCCRFDRGAVVCLDGICVRLLRNPDPDRPARLLAIRRRRTG
jgi:hypothetical protein